VHSEILKTFGLDVRFYYVMLGYCTNLEFSVVRQYKSNVIIISMILHVSYYTSLPVDLFTACLLNFDRPALVLAVYNG
jgi:hypothetical protein